MVIMGVDPGLNATGYGFLETGTVRLRVVTAGDIRPPRHQPLEERLGVIRDALSALILRHHPDTVVLEKLFTHHAHVTTAALMGHARGAACLAARDHGLPVAEYPPTQVKKSLTGRGHASKDQVARMVGQWLGVSDADWSADASDALALAIVHAHTASQQRRLPAGVAR
jgi:crossover junction endodeoxyribonuclease RuvC